MFKFNFLKVGAQAITLAGSVGLLFCFSVYGDLDSATQSKIYNCYAVPDKYTCQAVLAQINSDAQLEEIDLNLVSFGGKLTKAGLAAKDAATGLVQDSVEGGGVPYPEIDKLAQEWSERRN